MQAKAKVQKKPRKELPLTVEQQQLMIRWKEFPTWALKRFPWAVRELGYDEAISQATEALLAAVQYFDPTVGAQFSTYATMVAFHWLQKECRKAGAVVWKSETRQKPRTVSIDSNRAEFERGDNTTLSRSLPDPRKPSEWTEEVDLLQREIDLLPFKERVTIQMRLAGETLKATGKVLQVSKERVRQLEAIARRRLRERLQSRGVAL